MSDLHPELELDTWQNWGEVLRGTDNVDLRIHVRKELEELMHFARSVAMFNIAPQLRSALFIPFDTGWNRYINLVAMEIETMYNRTMGEPAESDEELAHQWELSGLRRP